MSFSKRSDENYLMDLENFDGMGRRFERTAQINLFFDNKPKFLVFYFKTCYKT